MPQLVYVKALMNYVGPLGQYVKGQEFKRPAGLKKAFEGKPQHFEILKIVDTEAVEAAPPANGTRLIDYTAMPGYACDAKDKRRIRWNGNGPVEFAGRRLLPGMEAIIPFSWLNMVMKSEGFSQVRGKLKPADG